MTTDSGEHAGEGESTLADLIAAAPVSDRTPAVIEFDRQDSRSHTREAVLKRAARLAGGLLEAGLATGDRVAIVAPNSIDWIVSVLGVTQCGGTVVPLDTQMPAEDLAHALEDAEPRWLFTTPELREHLPETDDTEIRLFGLEADKPEAWAALLSDTPAEPSARPEDIATIFYTSGTTGPPKGVPLTHANLTSNVGALLSVNIAGADDRILVPLPFHHVYPFTIGLLTPLALGAPLIMPYSLAGPQIVRALRDSEATILLGVPRLYEAIWQALSDRVAGRGRLAQALFNAMLHLSMTARERFDMHLGKRLFASLHRRIAPGLRLVVSGGAALDPKLGRRLRALGWEIAVGYGLSETSPIVTFNPPERIRLESAGMPLPGVEVAIDSDDGPGEVLVRGPNVFSGYRNLPDKSAKVLDDEGWFRTGDLGEIDADSYLHLRGRASAMIVSPEGENIDPERVEAALEKAEGIREAGILEQNGHIAAVVVPSTTLQRQAGDDTLVPRLQAAVSEAAKALPSHHRPDTVKASLDPLPRTRLGKLRRHKLEELSGKLTAGDAPVRGEARPLTPEEMAPEDHQLLSDPAVERTWNYLAERFHDFRLSPDSSLALDLNIDSLAWVDLTLALRDRAGIELDETAIARVETVRDLLREAAAAGEAKTEGTDLVQALAEPEAMLTARQRSWLEPQARRHRIAGHVLLALTRTTVRLLVRVQVRGRIPDDRPCLIAPRHLSLIDPFVLARALPRDSLRTLYWAGAANWLFTGPFTRWFSRVSRVIPIDQFGEPRSSLALAVACLQRGHGLIWFPEGRRSPDGRLQPVRRGVGLLLQANPVPVVPVWIEGTRDVLPPGRWLPRPGRVRVVIGEPLAPERLAPDAAAIAEQVHEALAALGEPTRSSND